MSAVKQSGFYSVVSESPLHWRLTPATKGYPRHRPVTSPRSEVRSLLMWYWQAELTQVQLEYSRLEYSRVLNSKMERN